MTKKIAVLGCKGNMGRRYTAILKLLGHMSIGVDIDTPGILSGIDGAIVATPTHTHFSLITDLIGLDIPILCEKPISKNYEEILAVCAIDELNLRMINQYEMYDIPDNYGGKTYYNYFKTGSDGLLWDCINIIGLAKGDVDIKNDSPIWDCFINGFRLDLGDMDEAYIANIEDWLLKFDSNKKYILHSHTTVKGMIEDDKNSNRYSM